MHETSLQNMAAVRDRYLAPLADATPSRRLRVIDVGGADFNGSYRQLFDVDRFEYLAADLTPGPGVDIVIEQPNRLPLEDGSVDVVLSGQMLEHGEHFWQAFADMMRVVDPDGLVVVIAPSAGPIHRYPVDCYRFYPDSLTGLATWAGVELLDWFHDQRGEWRDLVGVFGHRSLAQLGLAEGDALAEFNVARGQGLTPAPMRYETLPPRPQGDEPVDDLAVFFAGCAAALWPIETVRPSAWNGHIPFMFTAFDLLRPRRYVELGTHHGGSLFAACQARQRLGLDTECVAIDTWQGDEHAGFYGAEVYDGLFQALEQHDYRFPLLERTTFDRAVEKFDDGSVDLLLIDGLHTYEAVLHDATTWQRTLAPGGVVMFHDTNVHDRDFGVWRVWQELAETQRSFEFLHGHGLGVLVAEGDQHALARWVEVARSSPALTEHARSLYSAVSERSLSHASLPTVRAEVKRLQGALQTDRSALAECRSALEQSENGGQPLHAALDDSKKALSAAVNEHAAVAADLRRRLAASEADRRETLNEWQVLNEEHARVTKTLERLRSSSVLRSLSRARSVIDSGRRSR